MRAHRHPHGLVGALDRRQRNTGPARAQDDRRNDHVQPVKAACRQETRHCVGAAFDQDPAHPASTECCKDCRWRKVPIASGQPKNLDTRDRSSRFPFCCYPDAADSILIEDPGFDAKTAVRIDDDAGRWRPGDPAHSQLRVVGYRGTDADNNRVDQGPQPVEVGKAGRPVDVFRMPRFRRNTAIERLTDLTDHHELIDKAPAKRVENFAPGLRKRLVTGPENIAKL